MMMKTASTWPQRIFAADNDHAPSGFGGYVGAEIAALQALRATGRRLANDRKDWRDRRCHDHPICHVLKNMVASVKVV
jgi:hypothetical protein